MTTPGKPERKRWKVPAPKPRAARPNILFVRARTTDEDKRIAYAQWLVGCGMEARAAARLAARRPAAEIRRALKTLAALTAAKAKGSR